MAWGTPSKPSSTPPPNSSLACKRGARRALHQGQRLEVPGAGRGPRRRPAGAADARFSRRRRVLGPPARRAGRRRVPSGGAGPARLWRQRRPRGRGRLPRPGADRRRGRAAGLAAVGARTRRRPRLGCAGGLGLRGQPSGPRPDLDGALGRPSAGLLPGRAGGRGSAAALGLHPALPGGGEGRGGTGGRRSSTPPGDVPRVRPQPGRHTRLGDRRLRPGLRAAGPPYGRAQLLPGGADRAAAHHRPGAVTDAADLGEPGPGGGPAGNRGDGTDGRGPVPFAGARGRRTLVAVRAPAGGRAGHDRPFTSRNPRLGFANMAEQTPTAPAPIGHEERRNNLRRLDDVLEALEQLNLHDPTALTDSLARWVSELDFQLGSEFGRFADRQRRIFSWALVVLGLICLVFTLQLVDERVLGPAVLIVLGLLLLWRRSR